MGENGGDGEAAGALDVHEEGAGSRHKLLELVLAGLGLRRRVEKVDRENLSGEKKFLLAAWTWMISMGSGLREATATASTR